VDLRKTLGEIREMALEQGSWPGAGNGGDENRAFACLSRCRFELVYVVVGKRDEKAPEKLGAYH
jgi:hypothetical protein